jgi:hypothetical protein
MNRVNHVISIGALVAAVGATVSLAFQPGIDRPTQPTNPTTPTTPTQPGTPPRTPGTQPGMPSTQPGRDMDRTPGLNQPGRDSMSQPGAFGFLPGQKVSREQFDKLIAAWPGESKKAAQATMDKYGPPDGGTSNELIWHKAGPWKKVVVSAMAHQHNDPVPHKDVIMGCINMKVPQDKVADLIAFDSSLVINRTAGWIGAVCDKEENNFAALNLAHDIIQGSKTVQEAKDALAKVAMGGMQGTTDPITQEFKFDTSDEDTGDPGTPSRGTTPGMDRPGSTPGTTPRTPGMTDPNSPRSPGSDPTIPRTPGTTPPRDPNNPSDPTLPRRPGGG